MKRLLLLPLVGSLILVGGCAPRAQQTVVLYCSVDEVFSRPLIEKLETRTGLKVETLFDVEAAKTAGLANKLRSESGRPRADIFWSSALLQTQMLAEEGLLAPYTPTGSQDIPAAYRDPANLWTAMGVRPRIMVSHQPVAPRPLTQVPTGPRGQFAIANPQFGTTSDWAVAYASHWGQERTLAYFRQLKAAGTRIMPGNADVALAVAEGHIAMGITDTDDFLSQKKQGKSIFLVQTNRDSVLVPGTVALVKGAPHEANARKLMDVLTSAEFESLLVGAMPGVFAVRSIETGAAWKAAGVDFSFLQKNLVPPKASAGKGWQNLRRPLATLLSP